MTGVAVAVIAVGVDVDVAAVGVRRDPAAAADGVPDPPEQVGEAEAEEAPGRPVAAHTLQLLDAGEGRARGKPTAPSTSEERMCPTPQSAVTVTVRAGSSRAPAPA